MARDQPMTLFPAVVTHDDACCQSARCCCTMGFLMLVFAAALLFVGIAGPIFVDDMLQKGIQEKTAVTGFSSEAFPLWQNNTQADAPQLFNDFYFYNITNAEEYVSGKDKLLKMDQLGPYKYRDFIVKDDITFSVESRQYLNYEYFRFDRNSTAAHLDPFTDKIKMLNVPLMGVLSTILDTSENANDEWWQLLAFDLITTFTNASLFVERTPNETAFGYPDPTLEFVHSFDKTINPVFGLQKNYTSPQAAKEDHQIFSVDIGTFDRKKVGQYRKWNNQSTLNIWGSPAANQVGGSCAYQTEANIELGDERDFWIAAMFRKLRLVTNETRDTLGVKVQRFRLKQSTFQNSTLYPPNAAYYMNGWTGVANLTASPTAQGTPVFASPARLLGADPRYSAHIELKQCNNGTKTTVTGMCAEEEKHDSWVDVEPLSGLVFGAAKRLQINVQAHANILLLYPNFPQSFIPLAWIEQAGGATKKLADQFSGTVYPVLLARTIARWTGIIAGGFLIFVGIVLIIVGKSKMRKQRSYSRLIVNQPM